MTVFRRKRSDGTRDRMFSYDFWIKGDRYRGSTEQITQEAAKQWERREQDRIRRVRSGLHANAKDTPSFADWAEDAYEIHSRRISRPEAFEFVLRSVLKFFGRKPLPTDKIPIDKTAPYHDLYLGDLIEDPYWLERFEQWMLSRHLSPQTKNHYRSTLSVLYKIALEPSQRERTGITHNPVAGIYRDKPEGRKVTLTPDEIKKWLAVAPEHLKRAVTIAALAPAFRKQNIFDLQWNQIDLDDNTITVWNHKTRRKTAAPLVAPITPQLRRILIAWRELEPKATHVITYRQKPIKKGVHETVKKTLEAVGIKAGRANGATFHTLRHSAATELLRRQVPLPHAQKALGHRDIKSTLHYAHLVTEDVRQAAGTLDEAYQLEDLVVGKVAHPSKGKVGKRRGTRQHSAAQDNTRQHSKQATKHAKPSKRSKLAS